MKTIKLQGYLPNKTRRAIQSVAKLNDNENCVSLMNIRQMQMKQIISKDLKPVLILLNRDT